MITLKEEWIEKIKVIKQRNIFRKGGGYFTVMTDFYEAPEEIRNDIEMCKKVLLESNECIWNIPKEMRTIEFLEDIIEKGYKGNILQSKQEWPEEDFLFIKKYLSKKDTKPDFNNYSFTKGIFANKEMVLSLVKENNYHDINFLLSKFSKDKEIMFAMLDNNPNDIMSMSKSMKNAYFKDNANIFKVLKSSVFNYNFLPEKFQKMDKVIEYVLAIKCEMLHHLPKEVIENREKVLNWIKQFPQMRGSDIPGVYRQDYEIAKFMIEKDGRNFSSFEFNKNEELIKIAAKTYNNISYMPATEEYKQLMIDIVLKSSQEENHKNLSHISGNGLKAQMLKYLFPQLLIENKVYTKTIADFFKNYEITDNKESNRKNNFYKEQELLIECIKISPLVYEKISDFYKENNDFKVLQAYVLSSKAKGTDYKTGVSYQIKEWAIKANVGLDKYIFNGYLKQKLTPLPKVKAKKI